MTVDLLNPVGPLPAALALCVAYATAMLLTRVFGEVGSLGKFKSIDGLRGYLAFCVFLHHASIWYFYLRSDQWKVPPSHLFTHFGQSSVILFFMITGCLFFAKLLDRQGKPVDWLRLYVSRILRLTPLYYFSLLLLLLIVGYQTQWELRVPLSQLGASVLDWLSFTFLGTTDVNGLNDTFIVIAGVVWSLRWEWAFYVSLPIIAHYLGSKQSRGVLTTSIISLLVIFTLIKLKIVYLAAFAAGCLGAWLAQKEKFCAFACRPMANLIAIGCIAVAIGAFSSGAKSPAVLLLAPAFVLIAGGCTLFGLLTNAASRTLGEMAYSIYLLHGLLLYVGIEFVIGHGAVASYSPSEHWALIFLLTPLLICLSFLSFSLIERPSMQQTTKLTDWLRKRIHVA